MGNLLSGKTPKWLRWPSDRQIVFLLVCGLVTAALAIDQEANLLQFLAISIIVAFIGLIIVGWYDSLWKLALFGVIAYLLVVVLIEILVPSSNNWWLALVFVGPFWVLLTFFLWIVPRQIKENTQNMVEEGRVHEIPRPGYKLSESLQVIWILFWVVMCIVYSIWLLWELFFFDWSNIFDELLNFWTSDLFRVIVLATISVVELVDGFRKDERYFYIGTGLFTAWQVLKLWQMFSGQNPVDDYVKLFTLAFMLIGGSLLLRAAWNRPPPEAEIAIE